MTQDNDKIDRKLERELASSTEEYCNTAFALTEQTERAEKAEAEVEALKEQLESTKQLALKFWKVLEENGFKIELPK